MRRSLPLGLRFLDRVRSSVLRRLCFEHRSYVEQCATLSLADGREVGVEFHQSVDDDGRGGRSTTSSNTTEIRHPEEVTAPWTSASLAYSPPWGSPIGLWDS